MHLGCAEGLHEPFAEHNSVRDAVGRDMVGEGGMEKGGEAYIYGPGRSFMALKQRHVSSTRTGPLICTVEISISLLPNFYNQIKFNMRYESWERTASAALLALSVVTSSTVP